MLKLGVLGDPLSYTRSPELHRAGLAALGLQGESVALPTPREALGARLAELAQQGFRGVNLTTPLKEKALAFLARASEGARRARSVNTVSFEPDGAAGDTTDGPGFLDLLVSLGRPVAGERVVILGAGGAARSLAWALADAGALVVLSARSVAAEDGLARVAWRSPEEREALAGAALVVNATPIVGDEPPAPLAWLGAATAVVDLAYGERLTPWVEHARTGGRAAWDGLGLLVHQARRSLALWTGREVPLAPLERAVGWPR